MDIKKTYGGIVTWVKGNIYHISEAGYYIGEKFYEIPETLIKIKKVKYGKN